GFKAWPDQLAGRERVAAWPDLQNAAEGGLVKAELLLDRLGGETDLPADLLFARRTAAVDQPQVDPVHLVQTQPIEIAGREILAVPARGPEVVHRTLQIDCHDGCPKKDAELYAGGRARSIPASCAFGGPGRRSQSPRGDRR